MSDANSRPHAVVDASAWVSYLVEGDANHGPSERWLDDWLLGGHGLVIPGLALVEVTGAVSRRMASEDAGIKAASWMRELRNLVVIDLDATLVDDAVRLAAALRLRGADAVYAALAHRLALPLITWDRELIDRTVDQIDARTPPDHPSP